MTKHLLFIPTFNCNSQIERVFGRFNAENLAAISDILVIDNSSTDQTFETLKKIKKNFSLKNIILIQNQKNLGFGGSHKVAFTYAIDHQFTHCVVLHGDDQARLDDFIPYLNIKNVDSSFVFGSRFSWRSKTCGYQKHRILGNIFFNTIASIYYRRVVPDLGGSGLNIYDIKKLFLNGQPQFKQFPDDLTFHVQLLFFVFDHHLEFKFAPIHWHETDQVSNLKLIRHSLSLLRIFWTKFTQTAEQKKLLIQMESKDLYERSS